MTLSKCWQTITNFIINEILVDENKEADDEETNKRLFENSLQFYAVFLSKLIQLGEKSSKILLLAENVTYVFDEELNGSSLGSLLCQRLIKQFDKYFLVETNPSAKLIVANILKTLFTFSHTAKQTALNGLKQFFLFKFIAIIYI